MVTAGVVHPVTVTFCPMATQALRWIGHVRGRDVPEVGRVCAGRAQAGCKSNQIPIPDLTQDVGMNRPAIRSADAAGDAPISVNNSTLRIKQTAAAAYGIGRCEIAST